MTEEIKFGTDGWRGIIADDFTFANVRRVAGAIASYVQKYENAQGGVIVGYDARFASPQAARMVADVVAAAGIPVKLANDYTPTPAVSYAVKQQGAAGGVMVTSSHNPWNWNGVKFKAHFGGSATPAIMKKIEEEMAAGAAPKGTRAAVQEVDLKKDYVTAVCAFAGMDLIAKTKFKFAVDAMYGSGRGVLPGIFAERGVQCVAIRQELNPLFPGINPEPIQPHTRMLQDTVVREKCDAGLATDGDADRIAAKHGRKLHETSIGFKYVADLMMEREILMGGEESGGIGYSRFLPERDGVLNSLLLANVMAEEGKPLGQLVADLQREFGPHYYGRSDLHIPENMKQSAIQRARADGTQSLGRYRVLKKEHMDGVKFFLDAPTNGNGANAWVLFRASGTEPLLRLYTEASSPELVSEFLRIGETFVRE